MMRNNSSHIPVRLQQYMKIVVALVVGYHLGLMQSILFPYISIFEDIGNDSAIINPSLTSRTTDIGGMRTFDSTTATATSQIGDDNHLDQHHEQQQQQQQQQQHDTPEEEKQKPLNILLLYGDDWRHDSLGVAGTQPVQTPFLDRLSTEGIRFTHNCVTTSICWISRATLLTGQYLSKHRSHFPDNPQFQMDGRWNYTMPYLLRHKGNYHIGLIGKWNFLQFNGIPKQTYHFARRYEGQHWYPDLQKHITERNEEDAMDFLKEWREDPIARKKPFMLTVSFFAPHCIDNSVVQYIPQNKSMTLYRNITLRDSPNKTMKSWKRMPPFFSEKNEGRKRWHDRFNTSEKYDLMLKNYYRLITEVDSSSERIYNEIKSMGILNETLIIFTTDNGLFHGEHGIAGKWYPHEESVRVPLIIRDPRMPLSKMGTVDDSITLNVDLYSTILGAANVSIPTNHSHDGRDIADLYLTHNHLPGTQHHRRRPWRKQFYYEHPMIFSDYAIPESTAVIRKDYKYFLWPRNNHTEQLFHVVSDPNEENDLIANPQYSHTLEDMRQAYEILQKEVKEL